MKRGGDELKVDLVNRIMAKITAPLMAISLFSFKDYRRRTAEFRSGLMRFFLETKRLDNYLDDDKMKMSDKLSYFRKEIFKILKKEKLPKKLQPKFKSLAEDVYNDFEMIHTKKTNGAMDILRKKADNVSKLVILVLVAKIFPEVDLDSRGLKLMVKIKVLYARFMGFIDDFIDITEDKNTPHLNSFLTLIGRSK